ncbi:MULTISPECIES: sigma-70 family RNA polymerase sigma factor [Myxococcus]|uniref:sigma-70 family RNA polymerase sigma factor n=1 Tax=Myxococcus TaxID=32 RepID=UPI001142FDD3|nr:MULTISPECIES: sigma-70 family RNA polymerase sigma factor [Myxococcus]MCK8500193.1 sigma-70 family RNA polymerase sigma factor [Myxococcus fulvus]
MSDELALSEALLRAAPPSCIEALRALPELEATLLTLVGSAREAHPTLTIAPEDFVRHLATRLPTEGNVGEALGHVRADELLLAHACARGDARALARLEERLFSQVDTWFPREDATLVAEVRQHLRQRLLVPEATQPPRIASYSGRGPLARWARAIATRLLIDLKQRDPVQLPLEEASAETEALVAQDPELSLILARHRDDFRHALEEALGTLTPHERTLLRLHHVDNLSVGSVAIMYRTSRSTASRWILQARTRLVEGTRQSLAARLALAPPELESLLGVFRSHLEVSLHRLLQS